ncbi:MAG TPA: SGNH/GDSL hydrolase family protein, partial [Gemmataceae bacterium]|nr:SGNH/GDSL hydrolase family protein [Gemmataceae bacterium]
GNTLIEREQRYAYWEAALIRRHPGSNVTFRNLGWSGDTVWGEARAVFGTSADGYKALVDHVKAEKPTVIIVGYGTNESFAGEKGLPKFKEQYKRLLDDLAATKARFVLLAPPMFEESTWKGSRYQECKQNLKYYTRAIKEVAAEYKAHFVDEFAEQFGPALPYTDNGMHLSAWGYHWTADNIQVFLKASPWLKREPVELSGQTAVRVRQQILPPTPSPLRPGEGVLDGDSAVKVKGLKPGKYILTIDGKQVSTFNTDAYLRKPGPVQGTLAHDAEEWIRGSTPFGLMLVMNGPSLDQAEQIRRTIVEKNELYFHRWRPQNVTYLFLFRKHEQGNNAVEIPKFDPLVEAKEKEIAKLRVPREHVYELVPEKK